VEVKQKKLLSATSATEKYMRNLKSKKYMNIFQWLPPNHRN
jgi:hypothetical protein